MLTMAFIAHGVTGDIMDQKHGGEVKRLVQMD
jgi:hypothetical protein